MGDWQGMAEDREGPVDRPGGSAGDTDPDEALARRAATDRRAFATLYRRWAEPVYRYCARRLPTREAAEDATSQVWTRALASIDRFHGASFPAWLFTIAHNVIASTVRQPSYRRSVSLPDDLDVPDTAPGPEHLVIARAASGDLRAALGALTDEQRQVIDLRLADLTTAEIAAVTGRTPDAVKML